MACKYCGKDLFGGAQVCHSCYMIHEYEGEDNLEIATNTSTEYSRGTKAWLWICAVANIALGFLNIFLAATHSDRTFYVPARTIIMGITSGIVAIIMGFCYIVLVRARKKSAFFGIVACCAAASLINLIFAPSIAIVLNFVNPIVTYSVIKKYWSSLL